MKKRAAVLIGVNKTGGELPVLEACATGAIAVANWLKDEGFDVTVLTDEGGVAVNHYMVQDAIKRYVRSGTYHQLIIFFSGHGYWKNETELWLLSGAPEDANEAISWIETAEYAKDSGIPNVVLISDACRSIPITKTAARVRGSIVFPNEDNAVSRSRVDKYMAAAVGRAAYETKLDPAGKKTSVFTHCLLQAFNDPFPDTVDQITEFGEIKHVVSNRKLGTSLQRRVPELLAAINQSYQQETDAEVLSDPDEYMGRARGLPTGAHAELGPSQKPSANLREVAEVALAKELGTTTRLSPKKLKIVEKLSRESGFELQVSQAEAVTNVSRFEIQTGFAITGASVIRAEGSIGSKVEILEAGSAYTPGVVRVNLHDRRASSVGLIFDNGRGTVLAALLGYIAHVLVENNAVVSVNYIPSENSPRWQPSSEQKTRINRLRAVTNAAARSGVFRLANAEDAASFAANARTFKSFDPTLGLYASYAYLQADDRNAIVSILTYMYAGLRVIPFDVALLARHFEDPYALAKIAPFCPMLTQGWNLLRSRGVTLPPVLNIAQDELEPALWTTFKNDAAIAILEAMRNGELR